MKNHDSERLTRLLRRTAPPALEPDPHLPARIRVMARRSEASTTAVPRRRWVPLSLAAAALTVALLAGGYLGYSAATSMAASNATDVVHSDDTTEGVDAFWNAWSQAGFADALADAKSEEGE